MNNLNLAISIIIPMYNSEKYLGECLDSILTQTFKNFEVIVVDDCSTDNSFEIAESYIQKFSIFSMCGGLKLAKTDKNSGSASAPRNKGLELARGEYIFFVDSDDILTSTALAEIYSLVKKFNVDVLYCNKHYKFVGENFEEAEKTLCGSRAEIVNVLQKPLIKFADFSLWGLICLYIFKRELIVKNEIKFPDVCIGEDRLFVFFALFFTKRLLYTPKAVYYYRQHDASISSRILPNDELFAQRVDSAVSTIKILEEFMNKFDFFKENVELKFAMYNRFLIAAMNPVIEPPLNETVPPSERERIILEALEKFEDKTNFTAFLFNSFVNLKTVSRKQTAETNRLRKKLRKTSMTTKK